MKALLFTAAAVLGAILGAAGAVTAAPPQGPPPYQPRAVPAVLLTPASAVQLAVADARSLVQQGLAYGMEGARNVTPDRWLADGDTVTVAEATFEILHCPGHSPGSVAYVNRAQRFALVGDVLFVNKFLYGPELPLTDYRLPGLREPHRGDIIVFKYPQDEKRDFIKRIVATPGETVQVRGDQVFVNGAALAEPYVRKTEGPLGDRGQPSYCGYAYGCEPTVVPPDSYFVMGDNRNNSQDSRYWGFVKEDKIKGKAFLIYWSWDSDRHWLRWWRLARYIP